MSSRSLIVDSCWYLVIAAPFAIGCNRPSESGQLEVAIRADDENTVRRILTHVEDRGALLANCSKPALLLAFQSNSRRCIPDLVEGGARLDEILEDGEPVIASFARAGDPFWLEFALKSGADPELANTERSRSPGTTLLMHAIRANQLANVKLLLNYNARVNHVSKYGNSPITMAVMSQKFDIGLELLKHGADPSMRDRSGVNSVVQYVAALPEHSIRLDSQVEHFRKIRQYLIAKGELHDGSN